MYLRPRLPILGLALTLGAIACIDGTGPTNALGNLDARAVAAVSDSMLAPLAESWNPTYSLQDAFPAIMDQGLSYDQRPAADLVIPSGITGSTFVYDPQNLTWSVDSARTGAPADGVRVIWLLRDNAGNVILPAEDGGYIDLTDEDTGGVLSVIGIRMVAAEDTGDITVSDLTESIVRDTTQGTETYQATGFYGGGWRTVDFDLVSDVTGDTLTGHQTSVSASMASGDNSYAFAASVDEDSAGTATGWTYMGSITTGGKTAELSLEFASQDGVQTGGGTLSYGGEPRIQIQVQGSSYTYTDLDGKRLSASEQVEVDYLVRALLQTWSYALLRMPLLFF